MIDATALTASLRDEVADLVEDLRARSEEIDELGSALRSQWDMAVAAERTAHDYDTWREGELAQVAVSWVLGCVFVRFCEDNGLTTEALLSSPDHDRRRWGEQAKVEFFRSYPAAGEREYLLHVFTEAARLPGLDDVFGEHNPLWQFGPSDDACRALLTRWQATDPETGDLVWDFTDENWGTRFLGDLYQDLSEHAKKTYALLQTPEFVESFILDLMLEPALDEFGLNGHDGSGFRLIDPACGSGHFLLGAFDRMAQRWHDKHPADGPRAAAARALESIYGVDLNPFAASIARFRLLVAALRFSQIKTLNEAANFSLNIAVGDSLLHGPVPGVMVAVLEAVEQQTSNYWYETEDRERLEAYLSQSYHAVVANPPYITPKDAAANVAYRARYATCHRQYSLAVPFMERLFDLALRRSGRNSAGFVGQITANSFMKREFGKKVIEEFLAGKVDLTHVIDTSGAYIPGHGTPTVILVGRNRSPVGDSVRAVLGVRGEPSTPADPATGKVWRSIVDLLDQPGAENDYVSVEDVDRSRLSKHPWSLQGGAAGPLRSLIEQARSAHAGSVSELVGYTGQTNVDEVMLAPRGAFARRSVDDALTRPLAVGDLLRDWYFSEGDHVLFPYDVEELLDVDQDAGFYRWVWPAKTVMGERRTFAKKSYFEEGRPWWEWHQVALDRLKTPLSIAFAFVATHNHFVLDRGGKVFKQSAPVIKLGEGASVDDHLRLLGLLNSAVACFWMKQVFHNKGNGGIGGGIGDEDWEPRYEFDGTKLKRFPLADGDVLPWARRLDDLAQELGEWLPSGVVGRGTPSAEAMAESAKRVAAVRAEMVWLQEELDWRCAYLYGITDEDLSFEPGHAFGLDKGLRAFEIALARRIEAGDTESTWFERHESSPVTEPPDAWPEWYRQRIDQRLSLIADDRFVNLLERPEYKRRWNWESWDELADEALQNWLLTRLEDARYWPEAEPRSVAQLADVARTDAEFVQVAELYLDSPEIDLVDLIGTLTKDEAVPFLAAWRYKEPGMRKRASWERTWDLQRRQDNGEDVGKIPVPPKYTSSDFRSTSYWKQRGKLDVPKERFIAYPGAERSTDTTAVLGWAGWDHLQQAQALTSLCLHRANAEGYDVDRLVPLLAGIDELVPWLRQWHNEFDPSIGSGMGDYFAHYLEGELSRYGLSHDDLRTWPPPDTKKRRRRRKKAITT